MTIIERAGIVATANSHGPYMQWSPVFAGAVGASAISFLLLTFGAAIGLSITSPWPNAGAPAWAVVLAVGWWTVMVQIGSLFAGGYLAGRMRAPADDATSSEVQFRDSAHGFVVWAVAIIFGGLLLAYMGGGTVSTAAKVTAAGAGAVASTAGASPSGSPADYATDFLLRPQPATGGAGREVSANPELRAEINRIFLSTIKNRELTAQDRDYLVQVIAARDGTTPDVARQRVERAIATAQQLENDVRAAAEKARKYAIFAGFVAAASLLISLAAAVGGASLGGRHRDEGRAATLFGRNFW